MCFGKAPSAQKPNKAQKSIPAPKMPQACQPIYEIHRVGNGLMPVTTATVHRKVLFFSFLVVILVI